MTDHGTKPYLFIVFLLLLIPGCMQPAPEQAEFRQELLTDWNEHIFQFALEEDGLLTLKGVRTAAMLHAAVHDAVNSVSPRFTTYAFQDSNPESDPYQAALFASHAMAMHAYPDKKEVWNRLLDDWLEVYSGNGIDSNAVELGKAAAQKLIEIRADDRFMDEASYTWHPMAPGVYAEFNAHSGTPEGFVFGAGWAKAEPFLLENADQFRAPPPPSIQSNEYTRAYNEVKESGRTESRSRTPDQAHLAMWWKDFVENSHNRLARELVKREDLDLWETARLFALLNMSVYDAYVNVFDNKFHYNHWRPYTAIRWAGNDENNETEADTAWDNLHRHTYAFPSYPSAHGEASMAAMTVLARTLGRGDNYSFTMRTDSVDRAGPFSGKVAMQPPERTFESFSEAGIEAAESRIYLGIHFRYDSEEGYKLGRKVGNYAVDNFLTPLEE